MQVSNISFKGMWESKKTDSNETIYEYHPFNNESKSEIEENINLETQKGLKKIKQIDKSVKKSWTLPFSEQSYKRFLNNIYAEDNIALLENLEGLINELIGSGNDELAKYLDNMLHTCKVLIENEAE